MWASAASLPVRAVEFVTPLSLSALSEEKVSSLTFSPSLTKLRWATSSFLAVGRSPGGGAGDGRS